MLENRTQKTDLVWAGVYLSAVATIGLALVFAFGDDRGLDVVVAIDLLVAWMLSATVVVFLLTVPGAGRVLLLLGRVMIWTVFAALILAAVLGILSTAGVG
jgi:hypothetical protein